MVGDGQTMGKVESALSQAGGEVIKVLAALVSLAVMATATLFALITCASPPEVMVAVVGVPDVHVTWLVMTWVLLSLYVPVAVYCCVALSPNETPAGVTAMEVRIGAVTVRVVEPEAVPEVAVMSEVPITSVEAKPAEEMVAVAVVPEDQVAVAVKF